MKKFLWTWSWIYEKKFLLRSWIDEKILVYVVKLWRTLHNNDINLHPDPNIWLNIMFFV